MAELIKKITSCRVCKHRIFTKVIPLGATPLANAFLTSKQVDGPESYFPLVVYRCQRCGFLELGHVVSPEVLFGDYVYVSSTSPVFIAHFEAFATSVTKKYHLNNTSFVVDIGSNDGILLKPFVDRGIRVLGIEPADNIARVARKNGIDTVSEFFSVALARKLKRRKGAADIMTATNVFAHIDDLDEVIRGLDILLAPEGVFIIEAPYLIDFLQKRYFDLIYHEHVSYWAVAPLVRLFKRFRMKVFAVEKVDSHGGSIRVFVARNSSRHPVESSVSTFLAAERTLKVGEEKTYREYFKKIQENRIQLLQLLSSLKAKGKKIAGFGAPAKGNTLLNYFNIGSETLDYIVDNSAWKQGLYTPGTRIPVVSPSRLVQDPVDYVLILAWNFADSIIAKNKDFRKKGGKFIIPVPKPTII